MSVQFVANFHLLKYNKPLIHFENIRGFFDFLKVANTLKKYQTYSNEWEYNHHV